MESNGLTRPKARHGFRVARCRTPEAMPAIEPSFPLQEVRDTPQQLVKLLEALKDLPDDHDH